MLVNYLIYQAINSLLIYSLQSPFFAHYLPISEFANGRIISNRLFNSLKMYYLQKSITVNAEGNTIN